MKDYKRLTKRGVNGRAYYATPFTSNSMQEIYEEDVKKMQEVMERLCDLEDKIENGTLIELPCKVGTKVYFIIDYPAYFKPIEETTVNGVTQFIEDGIIQNQITTSSCLCFDYERDLGRTLFLTEAEAEAKLKELQGDRE